MADNDVGHASPLAETRRMRAQGLTKTTPADAPEIHLDDAFWRNARIVSTGEPRKTPVHLHVDPETSAFFRAGGKGHLTRIAKVLKA